MLMDSSFFNIDFSDLEKFYCLCSPKILRDCDFVVFRLSVFLCPLPWYISQTNWQIVAKDVHDNILKATI